MERPRQHRWFTLLIMLGMLLATIALPSRVPAVYASVADPASVTVAGDFQHLLCSGDWQANCAATHMSKGPDGVWRFTGLVSPYRFRDACAD